MRKIIGFFLIIIILIILGGCDKTKEEAHAKMSSEVSPELYVVAVNGKYGFIDKTSKIIVTPQFDDAGLFQEGLAPVKSAGGGASLTRLGNMSLTLNLMAPVASRKDLHWY